MAVIGEMDPMRGLIELNTTPHPSGYFVDPGGSIVSGYGTRADSGYRIVWSRLIRASDNTCQGYGERNVVFFGPSDDGVEIGRYDGEGHVWVSNSSGDELIGRAIAHGKRAGNLDMGGLAAALLILAGKSSLRRLLSDGTAEIGGKRYVVAFDTGGVSL